MTSNLWNDLQEGLEGHETLKNSFIVQHARHGRLIIEKASLRPPCKIQSHKVASEHLDEPAAILSSEKVKTAVVSIGLEESTLLLISEKNNYPSINFCFSRFTGAAA